MEIKKRYLQKYIRDMAVEQLADEYQEKGYAVSKNEELGKKYKAPLIARKGGTTIVFEVKPEKMSPERKQKMADFADYVRGQDNYKFYVILATPPREKKLQIAAIKELLADKIGDYFQGQPDFSNFMKVEEIRDVDIDQISIEGDSIFVLGNGVASFEVQAQSDEERLAEDASKSHETLPFHLPECDDAKDYDVFCFDFEVTLKYDAAHKLKIAEIGKLKIVAYED